MEDAFGSDAVPNKAELPGLLQGRLKIEYIEHEGYDSFTDRFQNIPTATLSAPDILLWLSILASDRTFVSIIPIAGSII